jgi:hypothetical protein
MVQVQVQVQVQKVKVKVKVLVPGLVRVPGLLGQMQVREQGLVPVLVQERVQVQVHVQVREQGLVPELVPELPERELDLEPELRERAWQEPVPQGLPGQAGFPEQPAAPGRTAPQLPAPPPTWLPRAAGRGHPPWPIQGQRWCSGAWPAGPPGRCAGPWRPPLPWPGPHWPLPLGSSGLPPSLRHHRPLL